MTETTKRCTRCQRTKPHSAFTRDAARADGLRSECKQCRAAMRKRARADNDQQRQVERAYYRKHAPAIRARRRQRYWEKRGGLDVERLARIHALAADGLSNAEIASAIRDEFGVAMELPAVAAWRQLSLGES